MAIGCGPKIAKIILFCFNFVVFILGAFLIACGIFSLVQKQTLNDPDDELGVRKLSIAHLCIGIFVFVLGFSACCGAIKESRVLLCLYIVMCSLVAIAFVAIGIVILVKKSAVGDQSGVIISKAMILYPPPSTSSPTNDLMWKFIMDNIQTKYECCGLEGPNDWKNTTFYKSQTSGIIQKVPLTCMPDSNKHNNFYDKGCKEPFKEFLSKIYLVIGIVAFLCASVMFIGVILGGCLITGINQEDARTRYNI